VGWSNLHRQRHRRRSVWGDAAVGRFGVDADEILYIEV
jgi:hypothetical protein